VWCMQCFTLNSGENGNVEIQRKDFHAALSKLFS
jgi:hypothetical protein